MRRGNRAGFTLVEVLAAFALALVMMAPIAMTITGVAGTLAALDRSAERRQALQEASVVAFLVEPVRQGVFTFGGYEIAIDPYPIEFEEALARSGWRLYTLSVTDPAAREAGVIVETLRMGQR
jgi:hypothetical protein